MKSGGEGRLLFLTDSPGKILLFHQETRIIILRGCKRREEGEKADGVQYGGNVSDRNAAVAVLHFGKGIE